MVTVIENEWLCIIYLLTVYLIYQLILSVVNLWCHALVVLSYEYNDVSWCIASSWLHYQQLHKNNLYIEGRQISIQPSITYSFQGHRGICLGLLNTVHVGFHGRISTGVVLLLLDNIKSIMIGWDVTVDITVDDELLTLHLPSPFLQSCQNDLFCGEDLQGFTPRQNTIHKL